MAVLDKSDLIQSVATARQTVGQLLIGQVETVDILQYQQALGIDDDDRREPKTPRLLLRHDPEEAGSQKKDKCQPAMIRDAPDLKTHEPILTSPTKGVQLVSDQPWATDHSLSPLHGHGTVCRQPSERLCTNIPVRLLCSGRQYRHSAAPAFRQPSTTCSTSLYQLNTYGHRAFSAAGPNVWNSLSDFIRDPTISADCFRRLLKTYLFARY